MGRSAPRRTSSCKPITPASSGTARRNLSPHEREQIRRLAHDLPALWHADSTTPEDRQTIARLLLEQVTVTVEGNTDRVDVELRWAGGFVSRHTLSRPVQTYEQLSNYDELVARIDALRGERKTLSEIAATLNAEGFHPPKRSPRFTKGILSCFLRERGVRTGPLPRSVTDEQHLQPTNGGWPTWPPSCRCRSPRCIVGNASAGSPLAKSPPPAAAGRSTPTPTNCIRLRRLRDAHAAGPNLTRPELITPKPKTRETRNHNVRSTASSIKVLSWEVL